MSYRTKIKPVALAVLATLCAVGTAHADEQTLPQVTVQGQIERADGPVDGYRATRSATFTKTDTPLKEVPASVSVVPADLMKDQAMQSLADVIRYVPGALAHQGEGNRDEFIFRGIGSSANLFVDGIRDDAQVFRDLYNLERVEVLKGAGGMIFGRGAGGILNRVTKKPVFAHVGEATVTVGQYNQLRATADIGGKLNDSAAWRLNVMGEGADSFRNAADLKRYAINPMVTLMPSAQTALTLGFEHLRDERTADRGFPSQNGRPFNADPSTFFGNADLSNAHSYVDSAYAILEHDFGGDVQLKNSLRVTHYDKFYQNVYPATTTAVNAANQVTLNAYNNANQRTNIFNQTDLTIKFSAGGFEHMLLTGLELGHQDSTSKRNTGFFGAGAGSASILLPAGATSTTAAINFRQNGTDANNNVKADIAAIYVQDQIALSREWKVLAGLRYDYFKATLDDRRTTTPAVDLQHTDQAFSPRLGLIWSPNSASTYYASYSYSFLLSAETLSLSVANANLDPENARNYEIGGRWDLLPNLSLSAAVFRLDRNNVKNDDGTGVLVMTGQQRTEGIELGLQGDITRNWQIYAGLAHLDARITKATAKVGTEGHRPQLVPENTLSVWNKFALGKGWSTGLGVIYQGESFPNADNLVTLPAFTRADGALYYAFADGKTRLALNIENLFDKKYFPTADANNNISVGAPRNARLTLSTAF